MREKIFEIIERSEKDNKLSKIYDIFMIIVIIASIIPLVFKNQSIVLLYVDRITVSFFIVDYFFRLCTADYKMKRGNFSFIMYPFTPLAIVDALSILPSFTPLNSAFRLLRLTRFLRALRILRVFKIARYSNSFSIILKVINNQKTPLIAVGSMALAYILLSALLIFCVEPESFGNFFDAIYWATVSLTTVGYGDIYPVSDMGRFIAMLSSVFGIAIIALPSSIITAGYMEEIQKNKK